MRAAAGVLLNPESAGYVVDIVHAKVNDEELYPSLARKAAKYAFQIIVGHPFVDGNKRTGCSCALAFLGQNGGRLASSIPDDDLVEMAMAVAMGQMDLDELTTWFEQRIV